MKPNTSWREEAWEEFLAKFWDKRPTGSSSVLYTTQDLIPVLSKYKKSGQGEIRIFHYGNDKINAVIKRGVTKIPVTRNSWKIVEKIKSFDFVEPLDGGVFVPKRNLTEGMLAGIVDTLKTKSNPGETTLLAIANHIGIIADFYDLEGSGILFTGGRQRAGINITIGGEQVNMSQAQVEIDGGFEWANFAVIAEMKSSFKQNGFDINQAMIPFLKWKGLLKRKQVRSLVLLAETLSTGIEYRAYDIQDLSDDVTLRAAIAKSKKYIVHI
jgi:hypothetical protein